MKILFSIFFIFLFCQASAQLQLPAIFSDHMILQRDKPVKIWGTAMPGAVVRAHIGRITGTAHADKNGRWLITLVSFPAGGPYEIVIKTKKETRIFSDVLFGEVWLCSGQSNMEFKVRQVIHAAYEMHRANNPLIRQVSIPDKLSLHPESLIDSTQWIISTPETVGGFTAVGYFFAREIYERLHIPVGLINDNWGGSQVESWISRDVMTGSDELKEYAKQMPDNWEEVNARIEKKYIQALTDHQTGKMPDSDEASILKEAYSFKKWLPSAVPQNWQWIGLPSFRGEGYMAREIFLDSIQAGLPSRLSLGEHDIRFSLFINGKEISISDDKKMLVSLAPHTWKTGRNIILIKTGNQPVPDWVGMGMTGANEAFYADFDGERISLADNQWKMLPLLQQPHHYARFMNNEGTIIYNAMIHPIISFSIRGVLWYQGEANTSRAQEYGKTFPLMIKSWRREWQDNFPFLFVQLSGFGSNESSNGGSDWAELREAQTKTLRLPGTGMAVTTDIGDPKDIHPKNKQEVGRRLAAIALNDVYGMKQTCGGPVYDSVTFSNGKAFVFFTSSGKGLMANDRYGYLRGFEIAGPDRKFYFARAFIEGNHIVAGNDSVLHPVAVRYGWCNSPDDINLYNAEGFPASPFRTDSWPGVTDSAVFYKP
jgi:sialate O-acetylesterase